ncbi:arginine--tRNA ligase [Rikenella microfusus]|uniref:Arginine--tRNA ligase n=1 Tax=Rikenella microfusus TaxID=28139 RepID=A0A379MSS2_9BACT|nr:arginine--tRNA ligase [Rikenella microfusus]SUE33940.1 Arginine--tRNA ligase [Rikenella microfusus]
MNAENTVKDCCERAVAALYGAGAVPALQVSKTRKEFEGDYTLVTFPLLKVSRKSPEATAQEIGEWLQANCPETVAGFNVIKGFLNVSLTPEYWLGCLGTLMRTPGYGFVCDSGRTVMVEYSSPNTNKPLHLGHIRNNLLGYSVSKILEANGCNVMKVNLVNDRGIHICKSMLAWLRFGGGETPESSGMKGDHLVGKYYVAFDKAYKAEVKELTARGMDEDTAKREAPIMRQAQEMLRRWEAKDPEVYGLWEKMNGWVYKGFDETYAALGVSFDKVYYESNTYLLGKEMVQKGLAEGIFFRKEDGSVWADLTGDGLDQKLLLRGDGTSVYMTQDLGTAVQRHDEYRFDDMIYVVGNEQNYHFQVLKLILGKLGYAWSDNIFHLSYGMVELPEGKMKSREGTVVDADDLIAEMVATARTVAEEAGKVDGLSSDEIAEIARIVGLGALKYFILKVDPKKTMLFDPKESIDFNGNTGPFIQYTYARIRSLQRRAEAEGVAVAASTGDFDAGRRPQPKEIELIKHLTEFGGVVAQAGAEFSPAVVAAYAYELAKEFNQYYHDYPILKADVAPADRTFRLSLAAQVAGTLNRAMGLLGIEMPERM